MNIPHELHVICSLICSIGLAAIRHGFPKGQYVIEDTYKSSENSRARCLLDGLFIFGSTPLRHVGHYEGDELVVDTIGFNDKSQIDDNYAVSHTTQLHVIERYKLIDNGKTLQASFTVEDPGAFNAPWPAMELFHPTREAALLTEEACAENNVAHAGDVFPIPIAEKADF